MPLAKRWVEITMLPIDSTSNSLWSLKGSLFTSPCNSPVRAAEKLCVVNGLWVAYVSPAVLQCIVLTEQRLFIPFLFTITRRSGAPRGFNRPLEVTKFLEYPHFIIMEHQMEERDSEIFFRSLLMVELGTSLIRHNSARWAQHHRRNDVFSVVKTGGSTAVWRLKF